MSGNPIFVESGRRGARQRWGEPRVLRLDELTPTQRRVILALVDAMKEPAAVAMPAGSDGVRRVSVNPE